MTMPKNKKKRSPAGTGLSIPKNNSKTLNKFAFQNTKRLHFLNKTFTLIELLLVLALIAVLSVGVLLVLNPAELIRQARDSQRLSDLASVNTSIGLFSADVVGGYMGSSSVVYVSIPDNASSTCGSLGLPALPAGWTYNCTTDQSLRNTDGTGWIPVNLQKIAFGAPLSTLPIDPINTTSTLYFTYTTNGSSWKLTSVLQAQKNLAILENDGGVNPGVYEVGNDLTLAQGVFYSNWVSVPGNSTFGTSNFLVMKYEAKCADTDGNLLTTPTDGNGYQIYTDNVTHCTNSNNRHVTSGADGYPITTISQPDAATYCQAIGAHLISNNEWQTIAWNIQNNPANWSGGVVGSGYLGRGNSNSGHSTTASSSDSDSTYGTGFSDFTHRRTHTLSNGQVIWDLAGNVWEWTSDNITLGNMTQPAGMHEFASTTNWGALTQTSAGPYNISWNSANGIGQIQSGYVAASTTIRGFIRGGDWAKDIFAGVGALWQGGDPNFLGMNSGFRCAR